MNMASKVKQVPSDFELGGETNYLETKIMYEKLWTKYQECFVFKVDTKYKISIDQMQRAPLDQTIWEYKEKRMLGTKHYLIYMPNSSVKHMLYIMLDIDKKPTTLEEIAKEQFLIINGQYSIAISKDMQILGLSKNIIKHFKEWKYFIVWSQDKS